MSRQRNLRDSVQELVKGTLACDCITVPTPVSWQSEVFRSLSAVYGTTDTDQLPLYLSHKEAIVREAAKERLQELQGDLQNG